MERQEQGVLVEIAEQPGRDRVKAKGAPKIKPIDRRQGVLRSVIVEELVAEDHKVRAIWDLTGELDLSGLHKKIKSQEGRAGRAAWNPRLLLSVWLYAYSEQITSAREIEERMEYEPALMWLAGLGEINHHTLSDFRGEHAEEFKKLLAELLGVLSKEGFVRLECVAHDGTKIRAQAGADTFRREPTLQKEIARAEQMVQAIEQQGETEGSGKAERAAARRRVAQERRERLKQATEELAKIRAGKDGEKERAEARVSLTEPEARLMKHGDNAFAPSYNLQVSTDAAHLIVVGMELTQCSSDGGSLLPAMEQVKATAGRYPEQAVADGGYTNQAAIEGMKEKAIEFYGSLPELEVKQAAAMKSMGIDPAFGAAGFKILVEKQTLECPAGRVLRYVRHSKKDGNEYHQYQAQGSDCASCQFGKQCCPNNSGKGRTVSLRISEKPVVAEFRKKMETEPAKQIYRKRGTVAEFPFSWIKEKFGLRKFRLRGMAKATAEALLGVFTYNVMQWQRLSWRPKLAAAIQPVAESAS
jgi:transposase